MLYIENALQHVLEGRHDINQKKIGNYQVDMKWDGHSAMVDINYVKDEVSQICHWDSLDKRIELYVDRIKEKEKKEISEIVEAIQHLGYSIKEINYNEQNIAPDVFKYKESFHAVIEYKAQVGWRLDDKQKITREIDKEIAKDMISQGFLNKDIILSIGMNLLMRLS